MMTGVGLPFSNVGVYSHWCTAVRAASSSSGRRSQDMCVLDPAVDADDGLDDDHAGLAHAPCELRVCRRDIPGSRRRLDVAAEPHRHRRFNRRWRQCFEHVLGSAESADEPVNRLSGDVLIDDQSSLVSNRVWRHERNTGLSGRNSRRLGVATRSRRRW